MSFPEFTQRARAATLNGAHAHGISILDLDPRALNEALPQIHLLYKSAAEFIDGIRRRCFGAFSGET